MSRSRSNHLKSLERRLQFLAKRIGEPALADAYVGEIHLEAAVVARSRELSPQAPNGGPNFHGEGIFIADVLMENYSMAFSRGRIGLGAASATFMLATVAAIVVPYLYSELRTRRPAR